MIEAAVKRSIEDQDVFCDCTNTTHKVNMSYWCCMQLHSN